jgi:hypothetical protein
VRVLEGSPLVPRILGYALIPTMASLSRRAPGDVTALYARGTKYLLLAGLPIGAFGALASEPFMRFLFGDAYAPSGAAARVLLPAAVFMFLSNFGETTLACVERWGTIVAVSTGCLLLNVALNCSGSRVTATRRRLGDARHRGQLLPGRRDRARRLRASHRVAAPRAPAAARDAGVRADAVRRCAD